MVEGTFDRASRGVQALQRLKRERGKVGPLPHHQCRDYGPHLREHRGDGRRRQGVRRVRVNFQHFWFLTRAMVDDAQPPLWRLLSARLRPGRRHRHGRRHRRTTSTTPSAGEARRITGCPINVYPELDREAMRTYYAEPERLHPARDRRAAPGSAPTSSPTATSPPASTSWSATCSAAIVHGGLEQRPLPRPPQSPLPARPVSHLRPLLRLLPQ